VDSHKGSLSAREFQPFPAGPRGLGAMTAANSGEVAMAVGPAAIAGVCEAGVCEAGVDAQSRSGLDSGGKIGEQETRRECCVCLEHPASHVMVPCGHVCVCHSCEGFVTNGDKLCPICRVPVITVVKVFF
jgi:hypothetical protein